MTIDKIISELQSIEYQLNSVELHVSCPDGGDMLNSAQSDLNILIGELEDSLDTWDYNEASATQ